MWSWWNLFREEPPGRGFPESQPPTLGLPSPLLPPSVGGPGSGGPPLPLGLCEARSWHSGSTLLSCRGLEWDHLLLLLLLLSLWFSSPPEGGRVVPWVFSLQAGAGSWGCLCPATGCLSQTPTPPCSWEPQEGLWETQAIGELGKRSPGLEKEAWV